MGDGIGLRAREWENLRAGIGVEAPTGSQAGFLPAQFANHLLQVFDALFSFGVIEALGRGDDILQKLAGASNLTEGVNNRCVRIGLVHQGWRRGISKDNL